MEDNRIIQLYQTRDEQAIPATKEKYGAYVRSVAYRILRNNEDAEECENDTYLGAWNAIPPAEPRVLSAFLARISRNLAVSRLRARNAEKRGGDQVTLSLDELAECIPDEQGFGDAPEENVLAELLDRFLRTLPETERRVFLCRYWRCDAVSEIAKQFGFGQSKVKMMLLRTRNKLRTFLEQEGAYHESKRIFTKRDRAD